MFGQDLNRFTGRLVLYVNEQVLCKPPNITLNLQT